MAKALPIAKWVKLINKHKFAKAALDKNSKMFVMHVAILKASQLAILVHLS